MNKHCSQHNKQLLIACFHKGCDQVFLCLTCYRNHDENHQTEALCVLEKDRAWTLPYEEEVGNLLNHQLMSSPPIQNDTIAYNKDLIEMMINDIIGKIQEKGRLLVEEMSGRIEKEQSIEKIHEKIMEKKEIFRSLTFSHYDMFDSVKEVRRFQDEIAPQTKEMLSSVQEDLKKWVVNKDKITEVGNYMKDSIQRILIDHLFVNDTVRPLNEYEKLKEEFDKLKKEKEEKLETLKSIYKAKTDNLAKIIVELKKKVVGILACIEIQKKRVLLISKGGVKSILDAKNELQEQLNAMLGMSLTCGEKYKIKSSGKSVRFCLGRIHGCQSGLLSCQSGQRTKSVIVNGGFFVN